VVTQVRNAQGLEPWAWGASVQRERERGGVISFASVDGLEEEEGEGSGLGYRVWPARAGRAGGGACVCVA
jgi:hypothetical protein